MADDKKELGVRLVADNEAGFTKALQQADQVVQRTAKSITQSVAPHKALAGAQDITRKAAEALTGAVANLGTSLNSSGGQVSNFITQLSGIVGQSGLVVGAIAAIGAAVYSLGARGAQVQDVETSFYKLAAAAGFTGDVLLGKLREAAKGTVSDFDLIKQTNLALAGAQGDFAKQFGEALPKLLEVARVQAKATGQSVDFLFQSLVTGIKRASPLLIDNTGITLKIGEANAKYAADLGKTVPQLTAQEQQITTLRATLEAGAIATQLLGSSQLTASDQIAQASASISNLLDTLGKVFAPITAGIAAAVSSIADGIRSAFAEVAPLIQGIATVIGKIIEFIGKAIGLIIQVIRGAARQFLTGAINIGAAFASGLYDAYNNLIAPAVLYIVQGIADFLVGFSPPKKGPLSNIDRGGYNIISSWLDGMLAVPLDPVNQVTAEVNQALGGIGQFSLNQVNVRLAQLDAALKPFQDRLSIVKAEFDAIRAPAEAALKAVDRQLETAVQALARGDAGAAELVRRLDAQRASLQDYVDIQQTAVDNAEIQLRLAEAMQAKERALLEIRKSQIPEPVPAGPSPAAPKEPGPAAPEKKPKGGGGAQAPISGGGAGIETPALPGLPQFTDEQLDLALEAGKALAATGVTGKAQKADAFGAQIKGQIDRINSVDLGAKLGDKLKTVFDPNDPNSAIGKAVKWVQDAFDPSVPNSIPDWIAKLPGRLGNIVQGIYGWFDTNIGAPIRRAIGEVRDKIGVLAGGSDIEGSIANFFLVKIPSALSSLGAAFHDNIVVPIEEKFQEVVAGINTLVSGPNVEGSIANFLLTKLPASLSDLGNKFYNAVVIPIETTISNIRSGIENFFSGTGKGSLSYILGQAVEFFAQFPAKVGDAIKGVATFVVNNFVNPIIDALNLAIGALEGILKTIFNAVVDAAAGFRSIFASVGQGAQFDALVAAARAISATTQLPRLAHVAPPAARGGLFSEGLIKVGERGPEYISGASKTAVFPNNFVQALETLTNVIGRLGQGQGRGLGRGAGGAGPTGISQMPGLPSSADIINRVIGGAGPQPALFPGNWDQSTTNNNQQSMTNNFYGLQSGNDAVRRLAIMQAVRGI